MADTRVDGLPPQLPADPDEPDVEPVLAPAPPDELLDLVVDLWPLVDEDTKRDVVLHLAVPVLRSYLDDTHRPGQVAHKAIAGFIAAVQAGDVDPELVFPDDPGPRPEGQVDDGRWPRA